jgi:hypothetical protein
MSLRFSYAGIRKKAPIVPLDGRLERPQPPVGVTLIGPSGTWLLSALVDTGSDDTLFPEKVADLIGVDLERAPVGTGAGVGAGSVPVRYAQVTLRIADQRERREWRGWVGFTSANIRLPILGFAGFLQYFTASFHGDREEVELAVNSRYAGT